MAHSRAPTDAAVSNESGQAGRSVDVEAQIASLESHDVLEQSELLKPWDIKINQVSPGAFLGRLDAVVTPAMMLYEENWSRRAVVRGATPPGYVLIGANMAWKRSGTTWCSSDLGPRSIATAPPSGEMRLVSPDDSHHAVLLVRPELLTQGLGQAWVDRLCAGRCLEAPTNAGQWLGEAVLSNVRRYVKQPELLSRAHEVRSLESRLLEVLIRCTGSMTDSRVRGTPSRRVRAVAAALEFAESRRGLTTALELSVAAGVSQRTLEYAFWNRLGTTPGRYLRILRLNGVQRDLVRSDPLSTRVWRVAHAWGFRHQGRFSARYREQFGELPHQTLRRSTRSTRPTLSDLNAG